MSVAFARLKSYSAIKNFLIKLQRHMAKLVQILKLRKIGFKNGIKNFADIMYLPAQKKIFNGFKKCT